MAITLEEWAMRLDRAARTTLPREIGIVATKAALRAERLAKRRATTRPRVRSGRLRASINSFVRGMGLDLEIVTRADTPYARIIEKGGTIRPKKGQFLAIPLAAVKTGTGVSRSSPRDFPDAFFMRSRSNTSNLVLVRSTGSGGVEPLFAMVREVKIRARPYLRPSVETVRRGLSKDIDEAFRRAIESTRG